ncbi:Indeterminate(ID)-domain 2 [Dorcoceras hygrometricum]|uniref:Indeterminate(ID)-domain 2 n=1 Tax=Dorcoceras hygrometricum TaxID=472368 RepID=A0A2Z7BG01_9LAMI|nr:Indeterminate(ID)-domain 2 [Dorcoceras hygrometricum]
MATNRFVCEICNKGFQRDQNLQLHRRGHNLPWKLKQRTTTEARKRVYICPEPSCVHNNPARALGDLTGIKKHYSRKHGEKKWKCDKCSKKYAVQSDWKAHQKTCGTREYKCDCGTIFSRRDSFITHRAFCDALAEENSKVMSHGLMSPNLQGQMPELLSTMPINANSNTSMEFNNPLKSLQQELVPIPFKPMNIGAAGAMFSSSSGNLFGNPRSMPSTSSGLQLSSNSTPSGYNYHQDNKNIGQVSGSAPNMSATALLQKAAQMGATASNTINSPMMQKSFVSSMAGPDHISSARPINKIHYDNFQPQNEQQSSPFINGGFPTQLFDNGGGGAGGSVMNDMVMYGGMLIGTDQNPVAAAGFLKNYAEIQEDSDQSSAVIQQGRHNNNNNNNVMARNHTRLMGGGNDMTTVDFLGLGGSRAQNNLHDQRMEVEAMNQQRIQAMHNHFHQQISHADSDVEKAIVQHILIDDWKNPTPTGTDQNSKVRAVHILSEQISKLEQVIHRPNRPHDFRARAGYTLSARPRNTRARFNIIEPTHLVKRLSKLRF